MNEFDEEADESHDSEADGCRQRDLGKLFPIRFRTPVQIGEETLKALPAICGRFTNLATHCLSIRMKITVRLGDVHFRDF